MKDKCGLLTVSIVPLAYLEVVNEATTQYRRSVSLVLTEYLQSIRYRNYAGAQH
jgi:hypothetical protein